MTTSLLSEELEPLKAEIEQVQLRLAALKSELVAADTDAEVFALERQRFDALRDVCNAIDRLDEFEAVELFWEGLSTNADGVQHLGRLRERIDQFEGEIQGVLDRQQSLQRQIRHCLDQLEILDEEVSQAYAREERRQDELVVEREASPIPYRPMIMPWSNDSESEKRYRFALLIALVLSLGFGGIVNVWKLPEPDLSAPLVIPERLAMLVKKQQEKPKEVPKPKQKKDEIKPEEQVAETPKEQKVKATPAERVAARTKVESTGVMAFKSSFKDLMDETPVAGLGLEARLSNTPAAPAGSAQASRSLVAMAAGTGSGSGGISNAAVSTNLGRGAGGGGGSGIGREGVAFTRVQSDIASLAGEEARPLSEGAGPARTDEEIQILFDRYKAALYRIYNKELRKDPTLRGKMVLRITIEPSGEVSACKVESSNINSPELEKQVVARVARINFGPKEGVPKTTILYPIDFLPAG